MDNIEKNIIDTEKEMQLEINAMWINLNNMNELLPYLMNQNPAIEETQEQKIASKIKTEYEQAIIDYESNIKQLIEHMKKELSLLELHSSDLDSYIHTSEYDVELLKTSQNMRDDLIHLIAQISIHYRKSQRLLKKISNIEFISISGNIDINPYINDIKLYHDEIRIFLDHFSMHMQKEEKAFDDIDEILGMSKQEWEK